MKSAVIVLPVSVLLSVGLLWVIRVRRKELDLDLKQRRLREIKMEVNIDLLEDSLTKAAEIQKTLEKRQSEIKDLTEKHDMVNARAEQAKSNYEDCSGDQSVHIRTFVPLRIAVVDQFMVSDGHDFEVELKNELKKLFIEQIGETQTEFSTLKNTFADERTEWKKQVLELKQQLEERSLVCSFLKPGEHQGRKLCKSIPVAPNKKEKLQVQPEEPQEVL